MTVSLTWVDAFATAPFTGNPAAVCILGEPMEDRHMQALAFELGIAETAFVTPTEQPGTFDLRWFTPAVEVDLCGHATLASARALQIGGVVDGSSPVTFRTRSGPLTASFAGDLIELDFPADPMTEAPLPDALKGQWDDGVVIASGTTPFFGVVVLASEEDVRAYVPDLAALAATGHKAVIVTAAAQPAPSFRADPGTDYVLRVFGPNVGIDEDPATGSAQCSLGPYWAGELGRPSLVAHQVSPRGAILHVRPQGGRVCIAGRAIPVFDGKLC